MSMSICETTNDLRNKIKQAIKEQNWLKVAALYKVLDITLERNDEEQTDYNFDEIVDECVVSE